MFLKGLQITLLFFCFQVIALTQSSESFITEVDSLIEKEQFDLAISKLNKHRLDSESTIEKTVIYHKLQHIYSNPEIINLDSAIHYLNREIQLLKSPVTLYERNMLLGSYYGRFNMFAEAENAYNEALKRIKYATETSDSINTYVYLGLSNAKQGKYKEGIVYIEEAISIATNSKDKRNEYQAFYGKAHYYSLTQEFQKREPLLPELLKLSEDIGDSVLIYKSYIVLVQSAEYFARYDSAEHYLNKALAYNQDDSKLAYYDHLIHIASIQEYQGKLEESKRNALKVLDGFKELNWHQTEAARFAYELLGDIYLEEQVYNKAIDNFTIAYNIAKKGGNLTRQKDYTQRLINTYKAQGKYIEIIPLMERHRLLSDSLFKDFYLGQLSESETRMGLTLKEKEIETQNLELEKHQKQKAYYIVLALLLGVLLVGAVLVYLRIKRDKKLLLQQKEIAEKSLTEKEFLLKEIHHRVKNNLQIVSSLLDKQGRNTADQMLKDKMQEGKDRIQSMALIHQNLYQSENLSTIQVNKYIQELTQSISSTQDQESKSIEIDIQSSDVQMKIDQAIPLGLILNELLTNAFKHAFKNKKQGLIKIAFKEKINEGFSLIFKDNGSGIQSDFESGLTKTLGLSLVRGLVQQLEGKLEYSSSEKGTEFNISF